LEVVPVVGVDGSRLTFWRFTNRIIIIISERELTFTFAICYRPSVCLSSVLSVVCL